MSKMQSAAVLAPLIDAVGKHGCRCDRRRLTNAVALLQDAAVVPVSLESGGDRDPATRREPNFPEQLSAELVAMRSDGLLTVHPAGVSATESPLPTAAGGSGPVIPGRQNGSGLRSGLSCA